MGRVRRRLMIVDGYNVMNAWKGAMKGKDGEAIADARDKLIARLEDYAGYSGQKIIVVFDAWQSDRKKRTVENTGALEVVFTQHGETADHYIERLCDEYARDVELDRLEIRVATSDGVEQTVVLGRGAMRMSARELLYEMESVRREGHGEQQVRQTRKATVMDQLPADIRQKLEALRREKEPVKPAKKVDQPKKEPAKPVKKPTVPEKKANKPVQPAKKTDAPRRMPRKGTPKKG